MGLHDGYQRFALALYNRAISQLHQRFGSKNPQLRQVVLTCCFIFITTELLQKNYHVAFAHPQQGLTSNPRS